MNKSVIGFLKAVTSYGGPNYDEFKMLPSVKCKVSGIKNMGGFYKITLDEI